MSLERLRQSWEILEGEQLKSAAELTLHGLSKYAIGLDVLERMSGGERLSDERLHVNVGGLEFDNPVMVGAGWDKKGRAVDGLYALGFSGTEVGSVLKHPQAGNPRPGLFYKNGVGLNSLGSNSPGMVVVRDSLLRGRNPGITGISLGKNKLTLSEDAAQEYAQVADYLYDVSDYQVINVASPNTPGLRSLLDPRPLTEIIKAVQKVHEERGKMPLFVKTTVDLTLIELDQVIEVCVNEGVTGIISSNTTTSDSIKSLYGWQDKPGGVSGNNHEFRSAANNQMRHITRESIGTGLQRVGVGGISGPRSAIERMEAGAQLVQVVTAIRQRKAKIARYINQGLIDHIEKSGLSNINELVGAKLN
jgi:dihydroorotate dehydrogenase